MKIQSLTSATNVATLRHVSTQRRVPSRNRAPLIFSSVASDTHREEGMKNQKKISLGLIGVGNWALFAHVRVLRLLPEYEIVAVYSQRKEAAMAAATEYGIPHV